PVVLVGGRGPARPAVDRRDDAAAGRAEVVLVRARGAAHDGNGTAAAIRPELAPADTAERRGVERLRDGDRKRGDRRCGTRGSALSTRERGKDESREGDPKRA